MDNRQAQIKEGAGLTESRLNQDFIDFLQKWGWPALMVVALVFLGYRGWQWYQRQQMVKVDQAFSELAAVGGSFNANPEALRRVAEEYGTIRGVGDMARIQAADAYLRGVRAGMKTGAELNADGTLAKPEEALSDEDRTWYLAQAEELYRKVADDSYGKPEKTIFRLNALYGLAAVAESRGEMDKARTMYEEIVTATDKTAFQGHAVVAKARIESLSSLAEPVKLRSATEFPKIVGIDEAPPVPTPGPDVVPSTPTQLDLNLPGFTGPKPEDAPKSDAPAETPKADAPVGDAPKQDPPKQDPPKQDPPKQDPPK